MIGKEGDGQGVGAAVSGTPHDVQGRALRAEARETLSRRLRLGLRPDASAVQKRRGLNTIPYLDGPLILLADQIPAIRSALTGHEVWFHEQLEALSDGLVRLWERAANEPSLFAPFAFPPRTKPSPVLTHNCAFASMRFAHSAAATGAPALAGSEARMREALAKASANPALKNAIALARATGAIGASHWDASEEFGEDRDSFYQAVGRRLVQLQGLPRNEAKEMRQRLVEKCLELGPRAADAAVLLAAANLELHEYVRASVQAYAARVREDADNRLLLMPIVDLFLRNNAKVV